MRPKVGVGVMVHKQGKVLLGQRKGAHGDGTWCMPGGHLEFGESFEDCARREVKEEAGLDVGNVRFVTATNDIFGEKHYITLFVEAEYVGGDPQLLEPDKFESWGWFSWDELPEPLFLPIMNLLKGGFTPR